MYEQLENNIKNAGLEKQVFYLGYRTDISQIMKGLDIFVLPSIKPDPFPTVVLEAMSLEIPVVATAQGGALEQVLDGVTGIHIPIDNPSFSAEKMEPLLLDAALRKSYGKKGKERVEEHYALEVFEKNIHQLIESIR